MQSLKLKEPSFELEPEGNTTNAELVELLEAELDADYCCPLTLVCSYFSFVVQTKTACIDSILRSSWHLTCRQQALLLSVPNSSGVN